MGASKLIENADLPSMNKQEISQKLDAIVVSRLFGPHAWLADREAAAALSKMLSEMKLQEDVPGEINALHSTTLGAELNLDLQMAFMGLLYEGDIPYVLLQNNLIDELKSQELYDALDSGADPEGVLRRQLQQAYLDYHNPFKACH
jgi:hypothetical protein